MKNPSPGSCFGGCGRSGDGTVPIGAALTTTMRRTFVAFIAWTMSRVPCHATPASADDRGPRAEITAPAPATAASGAAGPAAPGPVLRMRTWPDTLLGFGTPA